MYHVLNRSVAGLSLFRKVADYEAFERIVSEAQQRHRTRVVAWCLMRNHCTSWFGRKRMGNWRPTSAHLAPAYAMRWHVAHGTVGGGHLSQGRFKCFPVEGDEHFFTVTLPVSTLKPRVLRPALIDFRPGLR